MYEAQKHEYAGIGPSFEELTETEMQDFDGGAFTSPVCALSVAAASWTSPGCIVGGTITIIVITLAKGK